MSTPRRVVRVALPPVTAVVAAVVAWHVAVTVLDVPDYQVPTPGEVWSAGWRTRDPLGGHLRATLGVALVGLGAGAAAGVLLAVVLAVSTPLRRAAEPILVVSQSVPAVVLAPLFAVWFGFGSGPKVLVVALVAFFPIAISTLEGLRGADPDLVELLRGLGAGRVDTLRRVRIPAALPGFFAGARVAAAYAVFGAVVAEWMGASEGLGVYLQRSQASFRTAQIFAAVGLVAVAGIVLFSLVVAAAHLSMPWRRAADPIERTR